MLMQPRQLQINQVCSDRTFAGERELMVEQYDERIRERNDVIQRQELEIGDLKQELDNKHISSNNLTKMNAETLKQLEQSQKLQQQSEKLAAAVKKDTHFYYYPVACILFIKRSFVYKHICNRD
ncbi:hypothetical protein ACX12E_30035 [Paenibacillus vandeheii]|uniref:hypothetical protein n=1 Tax=Paenibacillus illinoisensis TaxID=59845 RepID=UPI00301DE2B1